MGDVSRAGANHRGCNLAGDKYAVVAKYQDRAARVARRNEGNNQKRYLRLHRRRGRIWRVLTKLTEYIVFTSMIDLRGICLYYSYIGYRADPWRLTFGKQISFYVGHALWICLFAHMSFCIFEKIQPALTIRSH